MGPVRFLAVLLSIPCVAGPTFHRDVLPILQAHCQACHRPGEIAPFPLLTYDQARPWAKAIKAAVISRKMPPWFAEGGHFANDRSLSAAEIKTLTAWTDAPVPGDPKDAPVPVKFTDGWRIDKPDAVFDTGVDFQVPERGDVPYQYFVVPTGFKEDRWVSQIDIRPGNRAVVHHVALYVRPRGSSFMSRAVPGKAFVPSEAGVPHSLVQTSVAFVQGLNDRTAERVANYFPGTDAMRLRDGQAMLLRAGSDLVFEVHYTTTGKPQSDRTRVGFVFTKRPDLRITSAAMVNFTLRIPPGEPKHRVDGQITLTADSEIRAIQPHMHLRGSSFEFHVIYPTGKDETLLKLSRYDFNWQTNYELAQPVRLPKGTALKMTATFDNSANNRANPDPSKEVYWGDQSSSEMLAAYIRLAMPVERSPAFLVAAESILPEGDPFEKDSWQEGARRLVQTWKLRLGLH
jgi:hypothetical protein